MTVLCLSVLCPCCGSCLKTSHSTQHKNPRYTKNSNRSKLLIPATKKFDSNSTNEFQKGPKSFNLFPGAWYSHDSVDSRLLNLHLHSGLPDSAVFPEEAEQQTVVDD